MKKIIIICLLGLIAVACSVTSPQVFPQNQNFPLIRIAEITSSDKIIKVAVSDTWLVIQSQKNLTGFDLATQKQLWNTPFQSKVDSRFAIVNDNLVAASGEGIIVVDKLGQKKVVNLGVNVNIDQLISINENFLYVMQDASWNLAVYDLSKNDMLWKIPVGRGITDVFPDSSTGIVYVVTTKSVSAFDNLSGTLLWQREGGAWHSVLDGGILYLCEPVGQSYSYKLSAINIEDLQEIWNKTFSGDVGDTQSLGVISQMLIVSTVSGLIAIDSQSGNQIWQTAKDDGFYTPPVEFQGTIYAKGLSRKIYAISPDDGKILGYVQMETDRAFRSTYETNAGVFLLKDGIAFNTNTAVFLFNAR